MSRWVTKGPPLSLGSLDPSQPDPYHHFRGGSGWESTGNQHPCQRLEQPRGHSKFPGRASATATPRKTHKRKTLLFSVHDLLN